MSERAVRGTSPARSARIVFVSSNTFLVKARRSYAVATEAVASQFKLREQEKALRDRVSDETREGRLTARPSFRGRVLLALSSSLPGAG